MRNSEPTANDYAMAWLRIAIGMLFLIFAQYKVFDSTFIYGGGFEGWIHRFLQAGAYPFMVPLLRDLVLPHARLVALAASYGELFIGLALTLGILVRTASAWAMVYMLILLFSSNYPGEHAAFWQYFGASLDHLTLALCFFTFFMSHPERVWSLSAYWRRKSALRRASASNPADTYYVSTPFGK